MSCTFQRLVDVGLVVVRPVDIVQVLCASLRDPVFRHIDRRVPVLLLDEVQDPSEAKGGDLQSDGARLHPAPVLDITGPSARSHEFRVKLFCV